MKFFPSKTIPNNLSGSLGLFRMGKTSINAKFHKTDLAICSLSRDGKILSYSQINTVSGGIYIKIKNARTDQSKLIARAEAR